MTNNPTAWPGPFESRAAFETFQDQSINRLAQFAREQPDLSRNPEHLRQQLWEMGTYLPAAILGLGRHNPDATELIVYGENFDEEAFRRDIAATGSHINPPPTTLKGEAAYERTVNAWHNIDGMRHDHRFDVQSQDTTRRELHAIYWDKKNAFTSYWDINEALGRFASACVDVPNTSTAKSMDDIDWSRCTADASDGNHQSDIRYLSAPFGDPDASRKLSTVAVDILSGRKASDALRSFGWVGLYQQLIWQDTRELLAGLETAPKI